jgi:hypothetical protein
MPKVFKYTAEFFCGVELDSKALDAIEAAIEGATNYRIQAGVDPRKTEEVDAAEYELEHLVPR